MQAMPPSIGFLVTDQHRNACCYGEGQECAEYAEDAGADDDGKEAESRGYIERLVVNHRRYEGALDLLIGQVKNDDEYSFQGGYA